MSEQKGLSRRKFLVGAGLATGALASGGISILQPEIAEAAYAALPWPYVTLNAATVKKRAYENYWVGGCMYASASSLITTLAETVGSPWDTIPLDMFKYGAGGVINWGTTCGALNGSSFVIQLCAGTMVDAVINELMTWYCNFPFPTTTMDSYARWTRVRTTVSSSPLCHQSSALWARQTRTRINSDERKDRCAKVAGDTVGKVVEYLNAVKAGTFTPVLKPGNWQQCMDCHVGASSANDNVTAKANCIKCHDYKESGHYYVPKN